MFREMLPRRERGAQPLARFGQEMENLWDRFFGEQNLMPDEQGFSPCCWSAPQKLIQML